jgi:hypothetical protein
LVEVAGRRELTALEASARVSSEPLRFAREIASVQLALEAARDAERRRPAVEQLVAWLVSRAAVSG